MTTECDACGWTAGARTAGASVAAHALEGGDQVARCPECDEILERHSFDVETLDAFDE